MIFRYSMGWPLLLLLSLLLALGIWYVRKEPPKMFFKARRELPAYVVIGDDDIEEVSGVTRAPGALYNKDDVLHRITTAPVERGAVMSESKLYKPQQQMNGWMLFTLPLEATPAPVAGEKVLLLSSKDGAVVEITDKALALGVSGEKVVVALSPDSAQRAREYLLSGRPLLALRVLAN
jgi:hypothetical protein